MKKLSLVFCAICIVAAACSKSDKIPAGTNTTTTNTSNDSSNKMVYIINGLTDISLDKVNEQKELALEVRLESGEQEKVTLSVEDLPNNVGAWFSTASGIPNFGTILTIQTAYAEPGSYSFKVKGVTESGSEKSYNLALEVTGAPYAKCTDALTGDHSYSYDCSPTGQLTDHIIVSKTSVEGVLEFSSIGLYHSVVYNIIVDCDKKTFTIPTQSSGGWEISGTGDFSSPTDVIIYSHLKSPPNSGYPDEFDCTGLFKK